MALTTGQVAEEAGVDYQTVLYYEQEGLIEEPPRLDNGYRQFPPETVREIEFIKRARQLDFTLSEIETLQQLDQGENTDCESVMEFSREKLKEIRQTINDLKRVEGVLSNLLEQCETVGEVEPCPIIETLTTD